MLCAGQLGITLPAWGSRSMQRTPALHSNDANSGDNCCHWEEYGPALRHHRDMGSDNPSWCPTADSQQQWIFAERTCWAKWVFCMFKNLPCIFFHYLAQLFYFIFLFFVLFCFSVYAHFKQPQYPAWDISQLNYGCCEEPPAFVLNLLFAIFIQCLLTLVVEERANILFPIHFLCVTHESVLSDSTLHSYSA